MQGRVVISWYPVLRCTWFDRIRTIAGGRRRFSTELKLAVVGERMRPGMSISYVAAATGSAQACCSTGRGFDEARRRCAPTIRWWRLRSRLSCAAYLLTACHVLSGLDPPSPLWPIVRRDAPPVPNRMPSARRICQDDLASSRLRTNCRPPHASYRSECGAPCKFPRISLRLLALMQSQNTSAHTTTNSHDAP
jgi:hypothetical protein